MLFFLNKVVTLQDQVVSLLNQQTEEKPVEILKESKEIEDEELKVTRVKSMFSK